MREYAKVAPKFWTGTTGRKIREGASKGLDGASKGHQGACEGTIVSLYLMSSPHSNMLGLYYQPILYMAHETGLGIEGASKGLQICIDAGFCAFDEASEMVWVYEMASYQIANELKAADRRCIGIQKDYEALPTCPFLGPFFDRYKDAFHLSKRRSEEAPSQPPSKPHRSQEQEQEQEQEHSAPSEAPSKFDALKHLVEHGVPRQVAEDWLKTRKRKRLELTRTALDGVVREAERANLSLAAAITLCGENGWAGFKASWLHADGSAKAGAEADSVFG